MTTSTRFAYLIAAAIIAVALAGCGNDPGLDEETIAATTAATTTSTTITTTTSPEPRPECRGEHRQAVWQVTGGWECEPIPKYLIDLDCIGDMIQVFSSNIGSYMCEQPPAPRCDDDYTSEWSEETRVLEMSTIATTLMPRRT